MRCRAAELLASREWNPKYPNPTSVELPPSCLSTWPYLPRLAPNLLPTENPLLPSTSSPPPSCFGSARTRPLVFSGRPDSQIQSFTHLSLLSQYDDGMVSFFSPGSDAVRYILHLSPLISTPYSASLAPQSLLFYRCMALGSLRTPEDCH